MKNCTECEPVSAVVPTAVVVKPRTYPDLRGTVGGVTPPPKDEVAHPSHYTQGAIECIDALEAMVAKWPAATAYRLGNVLKYLWRHQDKTPLLSLKKARWYLDREIASLESPSPVPPGLRSGSSTGTGAA